jgi:hypothetical protein
MNDTSRRQINGGFDTKLRKPASASSSDAVLFLSITLAYVNSTASPAIRNSPRDCPGFGPSHQGNRQLSMLHRLKQHRPNHVYLTFNPSTKLAKSPRRQTQRRSKRRPYQPPSIWLESAHVRMPFQLGKLARRVWVRHRRLRLEFGEREIRFDSALEE